VTAAVFVALPASALVVWLVLHSGLTRRLAAAPSENRWSEVTTPVGGGIGIVAGLFAGVGAAIAVGAVTAGSELLGILAGCAILFAAGLIDDLRSLPPLAKLAAQIGAAAIVVASGLSADMVGNDVAAAALAMLWLVGMTNAFNLLDNMDGLAGSLALVASAYFALDAATLHKNQAVLVLSLAVALGVLGFLPFNFRPRRPAAIFMGDSGSQVLGFALGGMTLAASWQLAGTAAATILLPLLVLAIPLLDTALVTVIRLLEGRSIAQGGRDHSSHRLVYHGLTEKQTVVFLAVIAAGLGATGYAYTVLANQLVTAVGVLLSFALLVQFAGFLATADQEARAVAPVGGPSFLKMFVARRRLLGEVVVDFAVVVAAMLAAYVAVVERSGTDDQQTAFARTVPAVLVARLAFFLVAGLYRSVWRYAGAGDAVRIAVAVVASELVAAGFVIAARNVADLGLPFAFFVVDALICTAMVCASRFAERGLVGTLATLRGRGDARRTLIVGAGRGGRSLLRELNETPGERVVGFVDDDPALRRRRLQGVQVLGGSDELEQIIGRVHPDTVLVTIPDAPRARLDELVAACGRAGVACKFVRRSVDLDPRAVLGTVSE
jgi:UDP-GlcNAc:undecaprenyl-phosphate GlcNAc-1-phosphate transferase